jgi:hypothetical protein
MKQFATPSSMLTETYGSALRTRVPVPVARRETASAFHATLTAVPVHAKSSPGTLSRAAIHTGRILNEGSCAHLACNSRWAQCAAEGEGVECPAGSAAVRHNPDCTARRFNVLFACHGRTGVTNTIDPGCRDTDRIITKPHDPWSAPRHCGQDLVVCGNHSFVHGTLWDRSNRQAWEVTPTILGDLGVTGDIRNGAIYPSETDAAFLTDTRCRPAAAAPAPAPTQPKATGADAGTDGGEE